MSYSTSSPNPVQPEAQNPTIPTLPEGPLNFQQRMALFIIGNLALSCQLDKWQVHQDNLNSLMDSIAGSIGQFMPHADMVEVRRLNDTPIAEA